MLSEWKQVYVEMELLKTNKKNKSDTTLLSHHSYILWYILHTIPMQ